MSEERVQDPRSDYAPPAEKSDAPVESSGGESGGGAKEEKTRVVFVPWERDSAQAAEWVTKNEQWNHRKADKFEVVYYEPGVKSEVLERVAADPNGVVYIRGHGAPGSPGLETRVGTKTEFLQMEDVCARLAGMGLDSKFEGSVKFHSCYSGTVPTEAALAEKNATLDKAINDRKNVIADVHQRGNLKKPEVLAKLWKPLEARRENDRKEIQAYEQQIAEREIKKRRETSIAAAGADLMRGMGFESCKFYGYLGPIESMYSAMDTNSANPSDWHKYVDLEGLNDGPSALASQPNQHKVRASVARVRIR